MVKVGLVGVGGWGKNHARVLSELGALAAICDRDEERASYFSKMYNVNSYTSIDEMLRMERLDAVFIVTPTSSHKELAVSSLRNGLHVFVEKPLAENFNEGMAIAEEGERQGRIVAVGYIERFNPAVTKLKSILDEGRLGRLVLLEFTRESRWPERLKDVGIVYDTVVHDIDTSRYIYGKEPVSVYSRLGYVRGRREDIAISVLEFSDGGLASLVANWITPKKRRLLRALFTDGLVELDFITQELKIEDEKGIYMPFMKWEEPLMNEDRSVINSIEGRDAPIVTAKDAVEDNRVADAILLSSERGIPIYLTR